MTTGAAKWIWENSRASNGSLLVLMAIAFEIDNKGNCVMSIAELAAKSRLSARAAAIAIDSLRHSGELKVRPKSGRHGRNGYELCADGYVRSCADSAQQHAAMQNLHTACCADSAQDEPDIPEVSAGRDTCCAESAQQEIPDVFDLGSVVSGKRSKPKNTSETPRPDVDRLCEHLADRIVANGSNRPKINQRWRTAARLMLDNDGRTEEDAHKAIDWCQQNQFWLKNVRSMEKLRQHYERLRLDAIDEMRKKARPAANSHQPTTEDFEALRQNWARPLQEAEIDPRGNGRPNRVHLNSLSPAED